jgi:hypothetical protein
VDKLEVFDCEQNSKEWYQARLGIVTASNFASVLAKGEGKTRATYMRKLAGEIVTGEVMPLYVSAEMERGHAMEQEAIDKFAFIHDMQPYEVGFMRRGRVGASPDRLLSDTVMIEAKSKYPHILIECLEKRRLPPEHVAQTQGQLWVAGAEEVHFIAYWPSMPLFHVEVKADMPYHDRLANECGAFVEELDKLVEFIRNYQ